MAKHMPQLAKLAGVEGEKDLSNLYIDGIVKSLLAVLPDLIRNL
jgi:hypothetical protein